MKFSVVIPACGCAKYLPQIFKCLEAQTFKDFEVLFGVEECDDDSLKLCREFAGKGIVPAEVGELRRTGAGGASRNWAFRKARGEYLVMLDGDDWLDRDALEQINKAVESAGGADAVMLKAKTFDEAIGDNVTGELGNQLGLDSGTVMSGMDVLSRIADTGAHCKNYGALVTVHREFLLENGLFQLEGVQSEDSEWVPRVLLAAKRVTGLREPVYNYRRRSGSVSSENSSKMLKDVAEIVKRLGSFYAKTEMPSKVRRLLENDAVSIFCWYLFNLLYARRFTDEDRIEAIGIARDALRMMGRSASFAKRTGLELLDLPMCIGLQFAKLYFGQIYYPLTGAVKGRL